MAINDEPELIKTMLNKESEEKKSFIFSPYSGESLTTDLDSLQRITKEVDKKIDTSPIESMTDTNIPSYPTIISDKYRQTLPKIDEAIESTIPSSDITKIASEFYPEAFISSPTISHIGLTVAQLIVLATGQNQESLKLTNTQIEQ